MQPYKNTKKQSVIEKRVPATLDELKALCERLYRRDGFVKWVEVAEILGVSRQAVFNRMNNAVKQGTVTESEFEKWRSSSSRRAKARENLQLKRENEKLRISVTLTPDNKRWLAYQCEKSQAISSDIINGLINLARERE